MFYAYYHCRRYGEDKEKIDAKVTELREKGFLNILKDSIWALISPVIVLGCIYAGIASPTEAAVISVFYALFVSLFIYKSIKVKEIWGIMVEAMKTYAPILFILAALLAVGGIGYYVKIVRPKQQAEDDAEFEDDGYGEGFDPDEAYGEPEYLSEDDFDDKDSK